MQGNQRTNAGNGKGTEKEGRTFEGGRGAWDQGE